MPLHRLVVLLDRQHVHGPELIEPAYDMSEPGPFFFKTRNSIVGPGATVVMPRGTSSAATKAKFCLSCARQ